MPGYGVVGAAQGSGLLPWSWALERLTRSHDYWVATVRPGGQPHVMPVWGIWLDGALWFSSSRESRKARNLARNPACTCTTDNPYEPVVVEGTAELIREPKAIAAFVAEVNRKYQTSYTVGFFNANACFRVRPAWAFGLMESDFTGSPTRWVFPPLPTDRR